MGFKFWLNKGLAKKYDLGCPIRLQRDIKRMRQIAEEDWPDLFQFEHLDGVDLALTTVAKIREDAQAFLDKYRDQMDEEGLWLLQRVSGEIEWYHPHERSQTDPDPDLEE
jgi:hypothetical protein